MSSAAERKAQLERQIADRRREEEERIQREAAELAELEELARLEEEETSGRGGIEKDGRGAEVAGTEVTGEVGRGRPEEDRGDAEED